ncbi:MAG: GGDEF domain-containing protein [Acetobacteraceae bacterium]
MIVKNQSIFWISDASDIMLLGAFSQADRPSCRVDRMNINFYGLPEFISYSILLGISFSLIRQKQEIRLQYWLIGWLLILLHASIFMLLPQSFPFDVLARGTLALAGQVFILAAYYQGPTTISRSRLIGRLSLAGALNLVFATASTAYAELRPADRHMGPFYLLIALGAASTIWLAAADRTRARWHPRVSIALTVLVYTLQAWSLHAYDLTMASQWLMCWTYVAVAYFFLRQAPKLTMGVVFIALSFVLWGLVFPVYSLLMIYAPAIANHVESEIWNLPKFLAAASMILVLLEEKVVHATHLATHDELTGLPNRRLYFDRFDQAVARATRDGSGFGFLVIDLNRFKLVNDTLGHQAGDDLLKAVSDRFRSALRSIDTLARTGGDEFTVILDGVHSLADAQLVGDSLRKSLEAPITLGEGPYYASASVGAAIYPGDGLTQIHLNAVADERMYAAKERGRTEAASPLMGAGGGSAKGSGEPASAHWNGGGGTAACLSIVP